MAARISVLKVSNCMAILSITCRFSLVICFSLLNSRRVTHSEWVDVESVSGGSEAARFLEDVPPADTDGAAEAAGGTVDGLGADMAAGAASGTVKGLDVAFSRVISSRSLVFSARRESNSARKVGMGGEGVGFGEAGQATSAQLT